MASRRSIPVTGLTGRFNAPGDKSISHRSLMLGALAVGETRISGLLEGEDVLATAAAMRALGATVSRDADGTWRVNGVGVGGLLSPEAPLDMGNSGTAVRLLMGMLATHPIDAMLTGDASLCSRPMKRVIDPLRQFTASFEPEDTDRLPLTVHGARNPVPINYDVPVPSAQVKSAVLLAGLNTPGISTVTEKTPTRDHTENMLRHFGADIKVTAENGGRRIELVGQPELIPSPIAVPGDPSSAAFPIVAALITPGSEIRIDRVGLNPLRAGLFDTLVEMGADLTFENRRDEGGEPVADIVARSSALKGVVVPPERAPSMIDEYPILTIAAAFAEGPTVMDGIGEMRIKESDRIAAMAKGLAANGVAVEEMPEGMIVTGTGGAVPGGGTAETFMDHRIAMSFLVMGCASRSPVTIDEDEMIATSFPGFADLMARAGAQFEAAA